MFREPIQYIQNYWFISIPVFCLICCYLFPDYWVISFAITLIAIWYLFPAFSDSTDFLIEENKRTRECTKEFVRHDELVAEGGDLIEFQREGGLYGHWGVYVRNKDVIHLAPNILGGFEIRKDRLEKITKNGLCRVNNLEEAAKKRGKTIRPWYSIEEAAWLYLDQSRHDDFNYSMSDLNCEHFATLCAYGEPPFSLQTENIETKSSVKFFTHYFDYFVEKLDKKISRNEI